MNHAPMLATAMIAAGLICAANAALAQAQEERVWAAPAGEPPLAEIRLYRQTHYRGGHVRAETTVPDLGIDWPIRSIRVMRGDWRVCTGENYTGNCAVMGHSIASIGDQGELSRIRSISPATALKSQD